MHTSDSPLSADQQQAVEAAVFRRLVDHLRAEDQVANIDLMILAGFCRNCLSTWYAEAASEQGVTLSKDGAREIVYGMPYAEWKARQPPATPEQLAAMKARKAGH
jgi:hypothetical protein